MAVPGGMRTKQDVVDFDRCVLDVANCIRDLVPCARHNPRLHFLLCRSLLGLLTTMPPGEGDDNDEVRELVKHCLTCKAAYDLSGAIIVMLGHSLDFKPTGAYQVEVLARACKLR